MFRQPVVQHGFHVAMVLHAFSQGVSQQAYAVSFLQGKLLTHGLGETEGKK